MVSFAKYQARKWGRPKYDLWTWYDHRSKSKCKAGMGTELSDLKGLREFWQYVETWFEQ